MPKRVLRRALIVAGLSVAAVAMTAGIASAAKPDGPAIGPLGQFLCPAVGQGVVNADVSNGDHSEVNTGTLASGDATFLPGNNQAGMHADANALNADNPSATEGPGGGNRDWSPIWPGDA